MAEAESPDLIILAAIWTALEASSFFATAIKPGNRIKETLQRSQGIRHNPDSKPVKQAGDLTEVDIDIGQFSLTSQMKVFGSCIRTEEHRQVFILTIITEETGVTDALHTKRTVLNALRASGRTLGIPKATLVILDWEIPSGNSNDIKVATPNSTGGQIRRKLTLNVAVRYRIQV